MIRKTLAVVSAVGVSALSFAQEGSAGNEALNQYMGSLISNTTTEVNAFLPQLGQIAVIGLVLFLALWAFRAVKRFLGR